ncbi:sensor histidine kinase [Roseivirga sp. E12]|uniref:sensor histidine kinase n=1 Tax=Roseivirga sp. E12 TaxID=2819237 RepID=UPI001ABD3E83|nr:histidine kinase [Roseivirga sp. E12]MBO3697887.1 sensor histidine kinase [Roseivirga sp. E12]
MEKSKIFHFLLWVFVFGLTFDSLIFDYEFEMALLLSLSECAINVIVSYVNLLILIPRILQGRGMTPYLISVIVFFIILFIPYYFSELGFYLFSESELRVVISFALNFTMFILVSFLFWKVNQYELEKKRNLELSNQKLTTELQLLKSQVSPHFLFNTLNNIYSLSITKHENTSLMIEKLSDLLRYIIYEGEQAYVSLEREMELLRNYTELQQLKKPKGGKNILLTTKGIKSSQQIPPLLLINIVENCFKHGDITYNKHGVLNINLEVENNQLHFWTENSFNSSNKKNGIGLSNVQQQLSHYYPGQHRFQIDSTNDRFKTDLYIDLNA